MGHTAVRVNRVLFQGKSYYVVTLNPIKERPIRLTEEGLTIGGPEGEHGFILADSLSDGSDLDFNYAALEYLFYEGYPLTKSQDYLKPTKDIQAQIEKSRFREDLAHALENHLFYLLEEWSIRQYKVRDRFKQRIGNEQKETTEDEIRAELMQSKDGIGWVAILDENKQIISTLVTAARTLLSPRLPTEEHLHISVPELPFRVETAYPILGASVSPIGPVASVLTFELKRFISDRKAPLYLLPISLYFSEKSSMSWAGPRTRYSKMYNHQLVPEFGIRYTAGQYVIECDAVASALYQQKPYNFPAPAVYGNTHIFIISREQFRNIFLEAVDISGAKISGAEFLFSADISRNPIGHPQHLSLGFTTGKYKQPSIREFKQLFQSLQACEPAFFDSSAAGI